MKYYAVFDTNVIVSALLSTHSDSATVLLVGKLISGEIIPLYSADIMKEYREVLNRKKFKFDKSLTEYILSAVSHFGLMIEPSAAGVLLPDLKDLPFYEVVMEKRKSDISYLITGNKKHFPIEEFIVTPSEMLKIINDNPAS